MQGEIEDQLVEAAKRNALAERHKTEAVRLANAAQEEREHAQLLKKRAVLAQSISGRRLHLQRAQNEGDRCGHHTRVYVAPT